MASLAVVEHRNQEATCYVGNLDPTCTEDLLVELFAHVGRVVSVYMPKDKLSGTHNGYGFVEFLDVADADYAIAVLNMVRLFGRPLRVSKSALQDVNGLSKEIGAKLFVGNLDPTDVDEHLLYDTFSAFGTLTRPVVLAKDEATGQSKGYAFLSYDSFMSFYEKFVMNSYFFFKKFSLSEERAFGLDSSSVKVEKFPMVLHAPEKIEMKRVYRNE